MITILLVRPLKAKWFQMHRIVLSPSTSIKSKMVSNASRALFCLKQQEFQIYPHWRLLNSWIISLLQDME